MYILLYTEGLDYTIETDEEVGVICYRVTILSDLLVEGDEDFLLVLQTEQEFVQLTTPSTTRITIQDSDGW